MSAGFDAVAVERGSQLAGGDVVPTSGEKESRKPPEQKNDVFISYSWSADEIAVLGLRGFQAWFRGVVRFFRATVDDTTAQSVSTFLSRFHERILREPLPKEVRDKVRPLKVWLDRASFHQPFEGGSETKRKSVDESLLEYVDQSRCMLLLASKGAAGSKSVDLEVSHFLRDPSRSAGKGLRIAVIEGADPYSELSAYLPPRLRGRKLEDSLGYDLRGLSKEREDSWTRVGDPTDALVRLAGDLLGVSGDQLLPAWRRQEEKQQRRIVAAVSAVALLIVGLTLGFSNERAKNAQLSTQKQLAEQKQALTAHEKAVEEEKARLNGAISQLTTDPSEALAIARRAALTETRLDRWTIRTRTAIRRHRSQSRGCRKDRRPGRLSGR